jgi:hypothetical protein
LDDVYLTFRLAVALAAARRADRRMLRLSAKLSAAVIAVVVNHGKKPGGPTEAEPPKGGEAG